MLSPLQIYKNNKYEMDKGMTILLYLKDTAGFTFLAIASITKGDSIGNLRLQILRLLTD